MAVWAEKKRIRIKRYAKRFVFRKSVGVGRRKIHRGLLGIGF
jgi:hypothetical protein